MKITWFGQAFFDIQSDSGVRVITDPFGEGIGYKVPRGLSTDVVTVSHQHQDHNNVSLVAGQPKILQSSGTSVAKGISFLGLPTFHDAEGGTKRGDNIVFTFSLDGIQITHMGDLGHLLSPAQASRLKNTDILMIPVGGTYTLDAAEAVQVIEQLRPKLVIPMHYRLPGLKFPLAEIGDFLAAIKPANWPASRRRGTRSQQELIALQNRSFCAGGATLKCQQIRRARYLRAVFSFAYRIQFCLSKESGMRWHALRFSPITPKYSAKKAGASTLRATRCRAADAWVLVKIVLPLRSCVGSTLILTKPTS